MIFLLVSLSALIFRRYLRTLNIDKDILSMRNFNIYDPMKRGEGLVLDGQTLAHIEVLLNSEGTEEGSLLKLLGRCITPSGTRSSVSHERYSMTLVAPQARDCFAYGFACPYVSLQTSTQGIHGAWLALDLYLRLFSRLDAVEDLLDHPTFEADFEGVTKGLPDLERIVSRIHAKNCKVKDFLNVLKVCFVDLACNLRFC